jgi:hypothetical protein
MQKIFTILLLIITSPIFAQTEIDGIMMRKKLLCTGMVYGQSSYNNYWEGVVKRDNQNLGKVSTTHFNIMGNYGITNKLNIIFNLPYFKTKASAGQLAGQQGVQDGSVFIKFNALENTIKKGTLNTIIIAGASAPLSNYSPDFLPLSIGLKSKTASIRLMLDYQWHNWYATASNAYIFRSQVQLDRNTYYTTSLHYTNLVDMADVNNVNIQMGYRSHNLIVSAILNQWNTLQGFDITRNNMPFVSNKMDATMLGLYAKYDTKFLDGLSFIAHGNTCIAGRNVGQTIALDAGIFYIINLKKKQYKQ